jgi:aspartate beta-hydroxylase
MKMIEQHIPRHYYHAFISAVTPGTHIMKHYGPTNKKLRFHMPIAGIKGSRLRAADVTRTQEEGRCYVFDDSFEHEAWH